MKLGKWALHYQAPEPDNFEAFRIGFIESNNLLYTSDYDDILYQLWTTACSVYSTLISNNMQRWLPADFYFHIAAVSSVWFFSLHLKQPALSDIDMICNRYVLPMKRPAMKNTPSIISVSAYLTGVTPADVDFLKNLFPHQQVDGNEITFHFK